MYSSTVKSRFCLSSSIEVLNRSSWRSQEPVENLLGEVDVSLANLVVEGRSFFLELLDVGLQEIVLARVEVLDEIVAPFDGDLIIDGGTSHMPTLEQIDDDLGGLLILGLGNRSLSPDDHRHQGQDRDQHQWT